MNAIDFIPTELRTGLDPNRVRFRLTDSEGRPANGGSADPLPVGEWSPVVEDPKVSSSGWHTTTDPFQWNGTRLWVVECKDFKGGTQDDKSCSSSIRPILEVDPTTVTDNRLAARLGRTDIDWSKIDLEEAYQIGLNFGPTNVTRLSACQDPYYAYRYALYVDRGPHDDTRTAASADPEYAYMYARHVDKGPRDETRQAACKDPEWAYEYAVNVDKGPRDDTREAACQSPEWAHYYALNIDKLPRDDTREAACRDSKDAYYYALYVDKGPRDDTRRAASESRYWRQAYEEAFPVTGS